MNKQTQNNPNEYGNRGAARTPKKGAHIQTIMALSLPCIAIN